MVLADDPFLAFLSGLSGQTVVYRQGAGGIEEALSTVVLFDLCRKFDIRCVSDHVEETSVGSILILGTGVSLHAGARRDDGVDWNSLFRRHRIVLSPRSVASFNDIDNLLGHDVTMFCRDELSCQMARLVGIPHQRVHLCHDLAVHLDGGVLERGRQSGGDAGLLAIGRSKDPIYSVLDLRSDRAGGVWTGSETCTSIVRSAADLIQPYAEVRTEEVGIAMLAAALGKAVVLARDPNGVNAAIFATTVSPHFPTVALAPQFGPTEQPRPVGTAATPPGSENGVATISGVYSEDQVAQLTSRLRAAHRDLESLRQESDAIFATRLSRRLVAGERHAEATIRAEAGSDGSAAEGRSRLVPWAIVDKAQKAVESQVLRGAQEAGERASQMAQEAGERASQMAQERAAETRDFYRRLAALDQALSLKSQQVLAVQTRLDEETMALRISETKCQQMRMLLDRQVASVTASEQRAEEALRRLQGLTNSLVWRALAPLRAAKRALGRLRAAPRAAP